ncbi:putative LRR receptor-like serine/threonine-protein kinase MRH1 [Apostasia shenzhenica]|uniref:Putative LRR receptor-like serine/threonine-protein kinase MRH1 n=1 Tax=Apostasia shenzhenica TaxID=1088818 RepID=A0A2I0B9J3_9ASPA|nr:putative LRR receptor-like serine/threonine-protein kinase MRH1 [Apostasia shenzhenica]
MGGRWNHCVLQLHMVLLLLLMMLLLHGRYIVSINPDGLALLKFRSRVDSDPRGVLRNWNPHGNDPCNWTGVLCVDGKVESFFNYESSLEDRAEKQSSNLPKAAGFLEPDGDDNVQNFLISSRRKLLIETRNLPTSSVIGLLPQGSVPVPSFGSGSFPAVLDTVDINIEGRSSGSAQPEVVFPSTITTNDPLMLNPSTPMDGEIMKSERSENWIYIFSLLAALLTCAAVISSIVHRRLVGAAIAPWKSGLSGQLQKALLSGVQKLNRLELEVACEDFSNIIYTCRECTMFKGTLSSGVEIVVASTTVMSSKDWSRHAEVRFQCKIDALSKVNHKNFINLLGYCAEDKPFMRMMVYEYAPNGTLSEHLHVKEFEHLDWAARMRILMGIAYCLQFMHHELYPPFVIPELQSSSIYLTDDYAAKISDISIWKEVAADQSHSMNDDLYPSESPNICTGSNVYSFGILMLEIVSGRFSHSTEGPILSWATECLSDKENIKSLVDPSLKSFKEDELKIICEIVQECIHEDLEDRPTMKEVAARLSGALGINPDAAAPRLSPLWWAELEILSVEAS